MQTELSCFLIDNDEDDQEIFQMAIREVNPFISCIVANDGIIALENLKNSLKPSFIFVDMNMPLMNGKQCLEEIRKIPHLANVPVYIYSTGANPTSIAETKALGASDFLIKPSGFRQLVELLSTVIPHP
jgi:CheY-like chemotaxis protein